LQKNKDVYLAIPALEEKEYILKTIYSLLIQSYKNIKIIVCVNQPEEWWSNPEKQHICLNNMATLELLNASNIENLTIIDKCSKGNGMTAKQKGVGWARKVLFDYIMDIANDEDIVISIDADTIYKENYIENVVQAFDNNISISAICAPYYHFSNNEDELVNRSMLRYEIYMRYYLLNQYIHNLKYCFTALGSVISFRVSSYKRIKGIKPVEAGEDFYLVQKFVKTGIVLCYIDSMAYPSTRVSDRVGFGTGKAIINGLINEWTSYPFYPLCLFEKLHDTFSLFPSLYQKNMGTPIDSFNENIFKQKDIWSKLRDNFKTQDKFIRACLEKFDALRINQFLKYSYTERENNTNNLIEFLNTYFKDDFEKITKNNPYINFTETPIVKLEQIRDILFKAEINYRKNNSLIYI